MFRRTYELVYRGLIFGRAYIWVGLYLAGLIFGRAYIQDFAVCQGCKYLCSMLQSVVTFDSSNRPVKFKVLPECLLHISMQSADTLLSPRKNGGWIFPENPINVEGVWNN